jgi:TM2 domain-containing membrane protein YozV
MEGGMAGQGSTGNVIAALCSFFIPGLGQLLQGRLLMAIIQFVLAGALWFIFMGWIVHIWSIIDAAKFKPKET